MKNILYIYPTSRAVRLKKEEFLESNSFVPKMLTIADFEKRVLLSSYKLVDSLHRTLFLKEASNHEKFRKLFLDRNLVKFYTQSSDFFKFFEEIALEKIAIKDLYLADTYAEFSRDLELLEELFLEYEKTLEKHSYTDRAFLTKNYKINWGFIESFDEISLELEGFLTKFELELFSKIAQKKPFYINLRTTPFNKKIQKEFLDLGIDIKENAYNSFELSSLKLVKSKEAPLEFKDIELIKTSERLEQIAIAMAKIEEFVQSGIDAQKIALVVPNEDIIEAIDYLDRHNNYNFAMGRSFAKEKSTIFLEALYKTLKGDDLAKEFLKNRNFNIQALREKELYVKISLDEFFSILKSLELPLYSNENFLEELEKLNLLKKFYNFNRVFAQYQFFFKEWLFFWLDIIKKHTLDDINGGKVTVLGVLETRSISFEAVVIIDFNEGVVPATVSKDRFLNTKVRSKAGLPTLQDRENLQKHYYARLLERAQKNVITYVENDELSASKFIYELGIANKQHYYQAPIELFYPQKSAFNALAHIEDKEIAFNAKEEIWSNSKLKTFLECKRKFFYRYVLKLKEPKTQSASDGLILHAVLAKVFAKQKSFSSFLELQKAFLTTLYEYEKEDGFAFKSKLWHTLTEKFLESQIEHFKNGWSVLETEKSLVGVINGLRFEGRVDRIDKKENYYLIIDYKTSATKKSNKDKVDEKLTDFQMNIYKKLLALSESSLDFAYINILDKEGFDYLKAQEEKDEKLLEHIEYLKAQKSFIAQRCENLQLCRNCAYRLLCHRGEYL